MGRGSELGRAGDSMSFTTSPPNVSAVKGQSDCTGRLNTVGKGHRLDDLHPEPAGNSIKSGGSRRHVGGASMRRLSRGSRVVTGVSPYIPCMLIVM
jgi:hypothetical protein